MDKWQAWNIFFVDCSTLDYSFTDPGTFTRTFPKDDQFASVYSFNELKALYDTPAYTIACG